MFPDAVSHYREIFDNSMELDIYIPSIKLGIELMEQVVPNVESYGGVLWFFD